MYEHVQKKKHLYYYIFISILMFLYAFEFSVIFLPGLFRNVMLLISAFVLSLHIITNIYEFENIVLRATLIIIGTCSYFITSETVFPIIIITISCGFIKDIEKILKLIFYERLLIFLFIVLLSIFGLISNNVEFAQRSLASGNRYALGYQHPNNLSMEVLMLILLYTSIKKDKLSKFNLAFLFLISFLLFYITKSRTTFIILIFCQMFYLFKNKIRKIVYSFVCFMPIGIMTFSLVFSFLYDKVQNIAIISNLVNILNDLLSYRLGLANMYFNSFDITVFGEKINYDLLKSQHLYYIVDSGYANLLFNFGILACIIFLLLYTKTLFILKFKNHYYYIIPIVAMLLLGVSENILRTLAINYTYIFTIFAIEEYRYKTISIKRVEAKLRGYLSKRKDQSL